MRAKLGRAPADEDLAPMADDPGREADLRSDEDEGMDEDRGMDEEQDLDIDDVVETDEVYAPPRGSRLPWALFILALAGAVTFGMLWRQAQSQTRQGAEVRSVTTRFLTALTNFKAQTIAADAREIRGFAVGDFLGQVDTFFGDKAIAAIRSGGVQSTGRVRSVFVESLTANTATVFGVVDESVVNSSSSSPRTEILRVEVQLIDTRTGWKVNRVDIPQSPTSPAPPGTP